MWETIYTILIGALVGWIASLLAKGKGSGLIMNIILGVAGGYVGGWIFSKLDVNMGDLSYGPFLTAVIGAFVLLWIKGLLFTKKKKD